MPYLKRGGLAFLLCLLMEWTGFAATDWKPCQIKDGTWLDCIALETAKGRVVTLGRLEAEQSSSRKTPLLLLAGGPGQAATEAFLPMPGVLEELHRSHDLLFFDPYGTGLSRGLRCEKSKEHTLAGFEAPESFIAEAQACLRRFGKSVDLNTLDTDSAARDLDALREKLGLEKLHLYGVSYGTRLALRYAALYPQRVDRLMLEGVLPPQALIAQDTQFSEGILQKLGERCRSEARCFKAFGDPWAHYEKLMDRYKEGKFETIQDPATGEKLSLFVSRLNLKRSIRAMLYQEFDQMLLPAILAKASKGDVTPLFAATLRYFKTSIYDVVYYSVLCREDVPFFQAEKIDEEARIIAAVCAAFPYQKAGAGFHEPVRGSWPTLLLSGEFDPVTGPELLNDLHKDLPASVSILAKGKGHNIAYLSCVRGKMRAFIEGSEKKAVEVCGTHNTLLPFIGWESERAHD